MKPKDLIEVSQSIADMLSAGLTSNGLVDPLEQRIVPHSYMTEHFAWQCSLLYSFTGENKWFDLALRSIEGSLLIEQGRFPDSIKSGTQYHWEFKNISLAFAFQIIGKELPPDLRTKLREAILNWNNLNIDSTNWTAMRAVSYRLRYSLFGVTRDRWRSNLELGLVLTKQTPDGFFPDTSKSYSFQYHVYTLALLSLLIQEFDIQQVLSRFLAGVDLIADFIDPDGDFNYFGRGQRQIFGYVSLIYALAVASRVATREDDRARYAELASRVFHFVSRNQPNGQWKLIVLNDSEKDRLGWYDYNYSGDYLVFAGVYLLLAAKSLQGESIGTKKKGKFSSRCFKKYYPNLGLGIITTDTCFVVMSGISREPAEPLGLVHLWPNGETCFGGPGPNRTNLNYQRNYIGPLNKNGIPILSCIRGTLKRTNNGLVVRIPYENLEVKQEIICSASSIVFKQTITAHSNSHYRCIIPLSVASSDAPECDIPLVVDGMAPAASGWKHVRRAPELILIQKKSYHVSRLKWRCFDNFSNDDCNIEEKSTNARLIFGAMFYRIVNRFLKLIWFLGVNWEKTR